MIRARVQLLEGGRGAGCSWPVGQGGRGRSTGRNGASGLGWAEQRRGRGKRLEEEDEADGGPAWSVSASVRDERGEALLGRMLA